MISRNRKVKEGKKRCMISTRPEFFGGSSTLYENDKRKEGISKTALALPKKNKLKAMTGKDSWIKPLEIIDYIYTMGKVAL